MTDPLTPAERRDAIAAAITVTLHALATSIRDPDDPASNRARARAGFMLVDALDLTGIQTSTEPARRGSRPTAPPPHTGRICDRCHHVHTPPDAPCHRPADQPTRAAGLAAARDALREAR